MTEEDAKTKWCPHAVAIFERVKIESGVTYREISSRADRHVPENSRCIGSACMMWTVTDNEFQPSPPDYDGPPIYKAAGDCRLARKSNL